jgi:hypothetical protein
VVGGDEGGSWRIEKRGPNVRPTNAGRSKHVQVRAKVSTHMSAIKARS